VTVERAATISENISKLPPFEERDRLSAKLKARGAGMGEDIKSLGDSEKEESDLRNNLHRLSSVQRVAVVGTYGRLLGSFPKSFVESLFPRPRFK
jgi:hypothetical protein